MRWRAAGVPRAAMEKYLSVLGNPAVMDQMPEQVSALLLAHIGRNSS